MTSRPNGKLKLSWRTSTAAGSPASAPVTLVGPWLAAMTGFHQVARRLTPGKAAMRLLQCSAQHRVRNVPAQLLRGHKLVLRCLLGIGYQVPL